MAAAIVDQTSASTKPVTGLRPVSLRHDLGGIAELIELCFGPTMDEAGRAAIREMRALSKGGSLMFLVSGLDRLMGGVDDGFVWIEQGRLVGNVSVTPANYPRAMGTGYIIANVAVHPNYRRQGMAQAMVIAALDLIRKKRGAFAVLQVDATASPNEGPLQLYTKLGFRQERTFNRWYHSSHLRPPTRLTELPFMTLRPANEWRTEYELAELVRPNMQGGLGWLRPTHPDLFRPSLMRSVNAIVSGRGEEHLIVPSDNGREILGALHITSSFGSPDRYELLVHPTYQGQLEDPLLNYALRRDNGFRSVSMEHPADDVVVSDLLGRYSFERRHTLIHMRRDI